MAIKLKVQCAGMVRNLSGALVKFAFRPGITLNADMPWVDCKLTVWVEDPEAFVPGRIYELKLKEIKQC